MPTNHDETIAQRYEREGREHLDMLAKMTPEQIRDLELQAHNALCDVDRLRSEIEVTRAALDGYVLAPVELLIGMMSHNDHDTRIIAERQLLAILAGIKEQDR